ncbi:hypothetical protein SKUL_53 [Pseudomonas phage Skulduggery]|uniref:Uncharacterized protein n=1 Tax=Pseudomonas phage Skulduggery TaxID=2006671 RepID=A0A1Y0SUG9_9CAUD|nr:hypothetical protein PP627_gp53 [Pseudomonas phage Skulduggery]ARV77152.1 hypothetical protein SKUL_53 [Pseudomonas phage Skulduggery]
MKDDKNLLQFAHLSAFKDFLLAQGAKVREGKGDYQAYQVRLVSAQGWLAVCFSMKQDVSTPVALRGLIADFNAGGAIQRESRTIELKAPVIAAGESAEQYAADLRDDVALRLFVCALGSLKDDLASDDTVVKAVARRAFRNADIFLKAGGHA